MADIMKVFLLALAAFVDAENHMTRRSNCEPLLQCETTVYQVNTTHPFPYANPAFESACSALEAFTSCVENTKAQCDNATTVKDRVNKVLLMTLYCSQAGRRASDEFQSQNCSSDKYKQDILSTAVDYCTFHLRERTTATCCHLTTVRNCMRAHAQGLCDEFGGDVYATGQAIYESSRFTDLVCEL
ncbi:uncharacterized protein LOC131955972 [Physella acuta]|uniref:uncharacterized protein LOC131955972 n=1 Tax=Physella acuta TaxID=109671 RepID=UPI0027DBE7A3|nr:uncharacterized protein LOC131955972 [Physella acuta]